MGHIAIRTESRSALGATLPPGLFPRGSAGEPDDDESLQFESMDQAFSRSGGFVHGDAMAMAMRPFHDQPISTLARWIVDRTVICVNWRGQTLLPRAQFNLSDMSPRSDMRNAADALLATHSDWDVALWFARPNAQLGGETPIDMIERDAPAVLQAAQRDAVSATRVPAHA